MKYLIIMLSLSLAPSLSACPLLEAIAAIESESGAKQVGDGGAAIGVYHIHCIYVDEVNRILGRREYTYQDRKNKQRSEEMIRIHLTYWGNQYVDETNKKATYEILARIHNGGPYGWQDPKTEHYWNKISQYMENNNDR